MLHSGLVWVWVWEQAVHTFTSANAHQTAPHLLTRQPQVCPPSSHHHHHPPPALCSLSHRGPPHLAPICSTTLH
jgi:hypothetical protein